MESFTGLHRRRKTTTRVLWMDRIARFSITAGGLVTIGAVTLVCFFLFWVVLPLFGSGTATARPTRPIDAPKAPLAQLQDDYRDLLVEVHADGQVEVRHIGSGAVLARRPLLPGAIAAVTVQGNAVLCGDGDGVLHFLRLDFTNRFLGENEVNEAVRALDPGAQVTLGEEVIARTGQGQLRSQRLAIRPRWQIELGRGAPFVRTAFVETSTGVAVAALRADGTLQVRRLSERRNEILDETTIEQVGSDARLADVAPELAHPVADHLLMGGIGDLIVLAWQDGRAARFDARDPEHLQLAERQDWLPGDRTITALSFLIGNSTLLVGDSQGEVQARFMVPGAGEGGARSLAAVRRFQGVAGAAVTAIHASQVSRLFLFAQADGSVHVVNATSAREMVTTRLPDGRPVLAASLSPKEDAFTARSDQQLARWDFDPAHPEFTLSAVVLPVHYENAPATEHVWQSTGGTDDFEPKFGLWPLVFGTLKATLFCMLFAVPIALLAAIYTSEFLHRNVRSKVKPVIELMASLPSVVLGFLAALVFAPVVEEHLSSLLAIVLVVPLVLLGGAQLWSRVPPSWLQFADRLRVPAATVAVLAGLGLAFLVGPPLEGLLFGGRVQDWLAESNRPADQRSSTFGSWLVVLLPLAGFAAALLAGRVANTFATQLAAAIGMIALLAGGGALLLDVTGFDLRNGLLGTYDQRNSLVVGFVMGFAVIPILYTIAEDALSAVPEHLRAASMGAGATPWQTAVRIILPTAMSGIFSAIMVALGRAVGETMIVLMAAGNTPVLQLNPFNGFRTLSANIATELPEAVRDSTHYRVLYLAAFVLFVLTFVLNSGAEFIRQRFRRRAFQL